MDILSYAMGKASGGGGGGESFADKYYCAISTFSGYRSSGLAIDTSNSKVISDSSAMIYYQYINLTGTLHVALQFYQGFDVDAFDGCRVAFLNRQNIYSGAAIEQAKEVTIDKTHKSLTFDIEVQSITGSYGCLLIEPYPGQTNVGSDLPAAILLDK